MTFWIAVAVVAYAYVGYPIIVWALAGLRPRPARADDITPFITTVIAAYDEEATIGDKINNCLALDYPPGRLSIVVVSDGSTDRTPDIAAFYSSLFPDRVRLIALPERHGKAAALNVGAACAHGDVLLLADARQRFDPFVARALARNFADPQVGAVSGELILSAPNDRAENDGLGVYWRYEKAIRRAESLIGSCIGYTGAVSAVRRRLFSPLPANTLLDDLVVPLRVIAQGYRVVFESEARAYDSISAIPGHEFGRKVRTLAGVVQTLINIRTLVGPLGVGIWCQFLSHKIARLATPYALAVAFVTNASLSGRIYRFLLLAQLASYGLGLAGLFLERRSGRFLAIFSTFLMLNAAAVLGPFRYMGGRSLDLWRPSPRGLASDTSSMDHLVSKG